MVEDLRISGLELILSLLPVNTDRRLIKKLESLDKNKIYGIIKLGDPTYMNVYYRNRKKDKRLFFIDYSSFSITKTKD